MTCSYCSQDLTKLTNHAHIKSCKTERERLIEELANAMERIA